MKSVSRKCYKTPMHKITQLKRRINKWHFLVLIVSNYFEWRKDWKDEKRSSKNNVLDLTHLRNKKSCYETTYVTEKAWYWIKENSTFKKNLPLVFQNNLTNFFSQWFLEKFSSSFVCILILVNWVRKGDSTTGARAALAPAAVEAAAALVLNSLLAQGCRWSQGRWQRRRRWWRRPRRLRSTCCSRRRLNSVATWITGAHQKLLLRSKNENSNLLYLLSSSTLN